MSLSTRNKITKGNNSVKVSVRVILLRMGKFPSLIDYVFSCLKTISQIVLKQTACPYMLGTKLQGGIIQSN